MSLVQLLSPPPTDRGFEEYSFAHYQHHRLLIDTILQVKGVQLVYLDIYPVTQANFQSFLENHQQLHDDYEGLLGIQGNDLSSVDFNDEKQRASWTWLNFTSHQSAVKILGQGA